MELYEEYGHCFSCGAHKKLKDIPGYEKEKPVKKEKENIQESISKIKSLSKMLIRQLQLPADRDGFYVVWSNGDYYKKRMYSGTIRYIGPSGHKAPIFSLPMESKTLVLIEGELNALSLAEVVKDLKIASPGSANEFNRHLEYYSKFKTIYLILDNDPVGIVNGVKTKEYLLKLGKSVKLILMDRDFNDLLQEGGPELVLKEWEKIK